MSNKKHIQNLLEEMNKVDLNKAQSIDFGNGMKLELTEQGNDADALKGKDLKHYKRGYIFGEVENSGSLEINLENYSDPFEGKFDTEDALRMGLYVESLLKKDPKQFIDFVVGGTIPFPAGSLKAILPIEDKIIFDKPTYRGVKLEFRSDLPLHGRYITYVE